MRDFRLFVPRCADVRDKKDLDSYGALVLSAVGDGVHTLFLRSALSYAYRYKTEELHCAVSEYARAEAQAVALTRLLPLLTEEELRVVRRGKNARPRTIPKHATVSEYASATAFEALTGYLYLSGNHERLCALYNEIYGDTLPENIVSGAETVIFKETKEGKKE